MGEAVLSYENVKDDEYRQLNLDLQDRDTLGVLKWAYEQFGDEIVYACSFGVEGMVLIDHIYKIKQDAKVIFLDTDFHFQQTYDLIERVKKRYPKLNIDLLKPELTPEQQAAQHGEALWKSNPDQCCNIRKLQPLEKALVKPKAWMSGLRRDQSPSRSQTEYVNKDSRFSSIKICPLIHWTWDDIWAYVEQNELPYNELHDQNYPSIGCEHCTLPVADGEDSRAGRWANQTKTECGLHPK